MKRLCTLAAGVFMAACMVVAVNAAPADNSKKPKQSQGIENSRKVMKHRIEQYKKMDAVRKKGQEVRRQAQSGK